MVISKTTMILYNSIILPPANDYPLDKLLFVLPQADDVGAFWQICRAELEAVRSDVRKIGGTLQGTPHQIHQFQLYPASFRRTEVKEYLVLRWIGEYAEASAWDSIA